MANSNGKVKKLYTTLTELEGMLQREWDADDSVTLMISSAPGIGKTTVIEAIAKARGYRFATMRAALYDAVEINGHPIPMDGKVHYCSPPFVPGPTEKFVLIFDELNRGKKDFIQASFRVAEGRGTDSWDFKPKYHKIVVLVNPVDETDDVEPLGDAFVNRCVVIHVKPDVPAFLKFAVKANINQDIRSFVSEYPDYLHKLPNDQEEYDNDAPWTSSRSLENLSKMMKRHPMVVLDRIILGALGFEIGSAFLKYVKDTDKPVSAKLIMEDKYGKDEQDTFKRHQAMRNTIKAYATVLDLTSRISAIGIGKVDMAVLKKFTDTITMKEVLTAFIEGVEQTETKDANGNPSGEWDIATQALGLTDRIKDIGKEFKEVKDSK